MWLGCHHTFPYMETGFLICLLFCQQEIMNGNFERETFIGHEAQHMRGVLALKYPMKNGIISNWDEMEKVCLLLT